ncbi:MAG: phosphatidate cytidylyltransferase [Bacteroidota bacterium]|nr:phosphatidate cytidylyltransferase [Bacteroidota bacterium]
MKKYNLTKLILMLTVLIVTLSSCSAIAGIFKAGIWFGVIGVIVIVAIIFWLINKARK